MTAREIFEGLLTELSKVNAPSMLLQDFNYFINKAINQYINKRYNIYDVNQQSTDDLRVLKATAIIDVGEFPSDKYDQTLITGSLGASLFRGIYEVNLPMDYLHMLNCICIYQLAKNYKCYNKNDYVQFAAKRLTADAWSNVVNDFYNRPLPWNPYYYIHNVNQQVELPTNEEVTDMYYEYGPTRLDPVDKVIDQDQEESAALGTIRPLFHSNFPREITLTHDGLTRQISTTDREAAQRYGNASRVRCEIRYGKDNSVFKLKKVLIDYIKSPQVIRLTQEEIDLTEDKSQIMEFPDSVCHEIINELVLLVMENTADPRLQTHSIVTQSVANPVQPQTTQPQPQQQQQRG